MRFIQILLILILTISVSWMGLLLFGPLAINHLVSVKTHGNVTIVGAKVTPELRFTAQKIDIETPGGSSISLSGAEVGWSLYSPASLKIILNVAKVYVSQLQTIENLQLSIALSDDEYPLELHGHAEKLGRLPELVAFNVGFEGRTDWDFNVLRDFKLDAGSFSSFESPRITVGEASVAMSKLPISAGIIDNDLDGDLTFGATEVSDYDAKLDGARVKFSGKLNSMSAEYETGRITLADYGIITERTSGFATYDVLENRLRSPTTIAVEQLSNGMFNVADLLLGLTDDENERLISGSGKISAPELTVVGRYVASVPELAFTLEISDKLLVDNRNFSGKIDLADAQKQIGFTTDFEGAIAKAIDLLNCSDNSCLPARFFLQYDFQVNGERLNGSIQCKNFNCAEGLSHSISTSDTHAFFSNMQALNWVSPLLLATAYAQMLGGKKNGKGNEVNF